MKSYLTVTDQFCGAGGSSQGVRTVARRYKGGLEVKLALNHWKLAIETHNTNFPETDHDCTDISACDPRRYLSTDILITSPECTNHSLAKGKKLCGPEEERSRATMWDVLRFTECHKYNIIIVENVVDVRNWVNFGDWLNAMHTLGYLHECVYLNSQHTHPTPQSRDRIYIVFWKKGNRKPDLTIRPKGYCQQCRKETETFQAWKNGKQSGKYRQQYVYRCPKCSNQIEPYYYAAFNCIDWSLPGTRIGDRKKALSENTIKRIQYGIDKYWNEPTIITTRYSSGIDFRVKSAAADALPVQPGDSSHGIFNPLIMNCEYNRPEKVRDALNEPGFTQVCRATNGVVLPFIIEMNRTGRAREVDRALSTILAGGNHHGVITPLIVENHGQSKSRSLADRLGCVTTKDKYGLLSHESLRTFLSYYYGGSLEASNVVEPARTFSTMDRAGLVVPGSRPKIEDCHYRMLLPHEVKLGMAFDQQYIVLGNSKEQVKQLGNAVTPPAMELLIERCIQSLL